MSAFHDWKSSDATFAANIERAVAEGAEKHLAVVRRCVNSSEDGVALRAAQFWLQARLPQYFNRSRVELTGGDGGPLVTVNIFLPQKKDPTGAVVDTKTTPAMIEARNGNGD